jgi:hypothetical protein
MGANKAEAAVAKVFGAILVLLAGLGLPTAPAGFRSPESLVRNVYAYDSDPSSVAFDNEGHAVTLNFILGNGPDGWVITDVESPHDSLRMFLAQHRS